MSTLTRLRILAVLLCLGYAVLAGRLFHLTVVRGRHYQERAAERCQTLERLPALRGRILDRQGQILAVDEPGWVLHVRVRELDGDATLARTARLLGLPVRQLRDGVAALETQLGTTLQGLAPAAVREALGRSYRVPGIEPLWDELRVFELSRCPEEHSGMTLHAQPDGSHAMYCCPGELRGLAAMERVVAHLERGDLEDLRQRVDRKRRWVEERITRSLGDRWQDQRRRQQVYADVGSWPLPIMWDLPASLAREMTLHPERFTGFEVSPRAMRRYPHGDCAINLLGLVRRFEDHRPMKNAEEDPSPENIRRLEVWSRLEAVTPSYHPGDFIGKRGLEAAFQTHLRGVQGVQRVERHRRGGGRKISHREDPQDGDDLVLTIDLELQRCAELALDATGRPGGLVLMDARTGAVLVLASSPRYDPVDYFRDYLSISQIEPTLLRNRALERAVPTPPGSCFKILIAIAGLESGAITRGTTFECDPHSQLRPRCGNHPTTPGPIAVEEALQRSCNTFFAATARACGNNLQAWMWKLGFGQHTGIEVRDDPGPGLPETRGRRGMPVRRMVGIGQGGIEATPLQIARLTAVVANGGDLVTPYLDATRHPPRPRSLGISPETIHVVRRGMEAVVTQGTASRTDLPLLGAAGKTGSAETIPDPVSGAVVTHAWFTGYLPRGRPEVVITVLLEHAGHGGEKAAPVAAEVLRRYLEVGR